MNGKLIAVAVIVVLATFIVLAGFSGSGKATDKLPYYASQNPTIKEAYLFAKENPDALNGVNCYCGCMQHVHDGRLHKRGLLDCFMKNNGSFEKHASECDMCINDALSVKRWTEQDKSKDEIKGIIDAQYKR